MMKRALILILFVCAVFLIWVLPVIGNAPVTQTDPDEKAAGKSDEVTWEVPIAAGIYYPSDGPVPEHPVRYYRVRCWPGCHTGSDLGKYPDEKLDDQPIFPTSTVKGHSSPQKK